MRPFQPISLPLTGINWQPIIRDIGEANGAVARFDTLLQTLPNPEILLSPLFTREAVISSRIEGIQATLQDLLRFDADEFVPPEKKDDVQEVINYRYAMEFAERELLEKPMTLTLIRAIHQILMSGVRGANKTPGAFRTSQNWIGRPGSSLESARFVPPPPTLLADALENLSAYTQTVHEDALVQAAILHAQFEIIHPFLDGNGRVGRILVPLYLMQRGLIQRPSFYISAELDRHRAEYYDRLLAITTANDWTGWIQFFLRAATNQAQRDTMTTLDMRDLYLELRNQLPTLLKSHYSGHTLEALFNFPVFTSRTFERQSKIPSASAKRILARLVETGILRVILPGQGRRPTLYRFDALEKLLSATD